MTSTVNSAIEGRYGPLAGLESNLSCGTAVDQLDARPGDRCLDLGCGRGRDVVRLAQQVGPTGYVWGVDGSPSMVAAAQARLAEAQLGHASVLEGALEAIPLPDQSVDWVLSNCALNHAADKAQVWREIVRVLKPGGRFVVSDIVAVEPIAERYRSDPVAVAKCWAGAEPKDALFAHLAAAGLGEVRLLAEKAPYRKQEAILSSVTIAGRKLPAPEVGAEPPQEEVMR